MLFARALGFSQLDFFSLGNERQTLDQPRQVKLDGGNAVEEVACKDSTLPPFSQSRENWFRWRIECLDATVARNYRSSNGIRLLLFCCHVVREDSTHTGFAGDVGFGRGLSGARLQRT